jgi:streptomycin 6-kinase
MNLSANGEAGRAWLDALPGIVADLQRRWGLRLGPPFEGGCVGYVAPAERRDGTQAVLKVSFVDDETRHEADALALWDGDGAVRLLDADPARGAMLLERLVPGRSLSDHPDRDEAVSLACGLLRRLWRPVPEEHPFMLVQDLAMGLAQALPADFDRFGRPFEVALVEEAAALCVDLAASTEPRVLVNRDFHLGNVLSAQREPWLAIDPKPLAGERVFDTGHLLRSTLPEELDRAAVGRLVRRLADELQLDPERVRAWALVRSVDDALWPLAIGQTDIGWDVACARLLAGR